MTRAPLLRVMKKLKRLKPVLKILNRSVFGNVDSNLQRMETEFALAQIESDMDVHKH